LVFKQTFKLKSVREIKFRRGTVPPFFLEIVIDNLNARGESVDQVGLNEGDAVRSDHCHRIRLCLNHYLARMFFLC
jgi:capsule polysaccharide modification protein KpsS